MTIHTEIAAKGNDDAILLAWEQHKAAHGVYAALPFGEGLPVGCYTPAEQEQWDLIDAAEAVIKDTIATTPEGVEIQLWVSLAHSLTARPDEQAARARNLDYFLADEGRFDWTDRLLIGAIRSLRAMGEAERSTFSYRADAYWAAHAAYKAFRDQHDGEQAGYDESVSPLITAAHEAAISAVKTPVSGKDDLIAKVAIFEHEQLHGNGDTQQIKDLFDFIVDDIVDVAPGAYRNGGVA